jgi:drug/metabolite transporter (DMT)-like permease
MSNTAAAAGPPNRLAFPAMVAGSIALAFGPWMVRMADVPPVASAFWRLALAVVPLLVLARLVAGSTPVMVQGLDRRAIALVALSGLFFAIDLLLWHLGIVRTVLANATLLANGASFMLPLWGIVVLRQRPSRTALLAIGLALVGTLFLVGASAQLSADHLSGDLLCLGAAVFYTCYLIVVDQVRGPNVQSAGAAAVGTQPVAAQPVAALPLLALSSLAGAVVLLPIALATGPVLPGDWTPLLLLSLGSQVIGQGLIVFAVGHLRPLVIGLTLLVQPAFAAIIGALRFNEIPGPITAFGAALIVAALVLVRLPARR